MDSKERNCARCGNAYIEQHEIWPLYPMCQTCEVKVYGMVSATAAPIPVSIPEPIDPVGDCAPSAIF